MTLALRSGLMAFIILIIGAIGFSTSAEAAKKAKIDAKVEDALVEFHKLVTDADQLLERAAGVLIFPSVKKGGIGIGGESGSGALQINGETVGYYRTSSASIGFQLGYQSRSQIILFLEQSALDGFRNSANWEIGVDGSVTVVTLGAAGDIDTATLNKPAIAFIFGGKGLMYNLTLEGSKISPIHPD